MIRLITSWLASLVLGMLVVGPLAALGVCALVDVGPDGTTRASLFPAAVAVLDPFVWTTLRHSATVAGIASLAAIVGGTIVGRAVGESGGPSRLAAVVVLGLAAASPPYLIALGASAWLDVGGSSAWGRLALGSRWLPVDPGWAAWTAAASVPAAALGALVYLQALDALGGSWRDAAALAGGGRVGRWRRLAWPSLRPAMARAGAWTFAITLADPGPPLLLDLRRTLGSRMVLAATGDAPFPALATLALAAILTVAAWRAVLRLWSGRDRGGAAVAREARLRAPASWPRAVAAGSVAAGFGGFVMAAMVGLGMVGWEAGADAAARRSLATDPEMTGVVVRSLLLGLGAAALTTASDRWVARLEAAAGTAAAGRFRRLARLAAPPPLVAGVVVLALGRLLTLAAAAGWIGASPAVPYLAGDRAPLVAATLAVWLAVATTRIDRRPLGTAEADAAAGRRFDAAVLAGARRGSARRLARAAGFAGEGRRDFATTFAAAAVALAPTVLIASSATIATVGPGVLLYRERPGLGAAFAATLGVIAWAVALATGPTAAATNSSRTSASAERTG